MVSAKPLSPKPGALSYPFSTPLLLSLRWIGAKYQYRVSDDGGSSWSPDFTDVPDQDSDSDQADERRVTITSLTIGTEYTLEVRAHNATRIGLPVRGTIIAATTPDRPGNLTATPGDQEVILTWTVPSSDGGIPFHYEYSVKDETDNMVLFGFTKVPDSDSDGDFSDELTITVTNLINGHEYSFSVRSRNTSGASGVRETTATPSAPATSPDPPATLTANPGDTQADLAWTPPAYDGGAAITKYQYRVSDDGGNNWNPDWTDVADGSDSGSDQADERSLTVTGLANGTLHTFQVRAVNSVGSGSGAETTATPVTATATIEAVQSPIIEGEQEVQFSITLSSEAPAGGVDVMVELTQETPANPGSIADADLRVHTVNIPQGQTQAILEVLSSRNEIQSNTNQVNAEILPGTGYTVGANSEASVQVDDNDQVNIGFAAGCGNAITVGETNGEVSFDLVLDNPVSYKFNVVLTAARDTATPGNDYSGGVKVVEFEGHQTRVTVTYTILDDHKLEETESFTIKMLRNNLNADILTPTCGQSNPHLRIEIIDDDIPTIVLDAPAEVTEGRPISIGLGPRPNVGCPVQFPFTTTLTISGDTDALQGNPATSVPLRLSTCEGPNNVKIYYDRDTQSDPIYQTIDRPGIQGDRKVTFTISPLMSDYSTLVNQLIPDRMSATVIIKDKPNNEASGSPVITGEPMVGQTLTADTSGINDKDGINNAVFTYRWYRCEGQGTKNLSTQSTYTVQESDIGRQIQLVVSFTDDVGYQERISSTPTDAVVPDVRYYFLRTEKSIEEPQSGQREVGTWVYLNDWPLVRSADGTKVHFWGVEPVVPFNIPYTVSYEDGARASWFEVAPVTFRATTYTNQFVLQGRSELVITIKQISKEVNGREVPAGQELGKIVITLGDYLDLPNGPRLSFRDGDHKLTMTIISNGKD